MTRTHTSYLIEYWVGDDYWGVGETVFHTKKHAIAHAKEYCKNKDEVYRIIKIAKEE